MLRRTLLRVGVIAVALLAFVVPVAAGGWAVVTLDTAPVEPQAGETLHLGFMVRQHGKTPIDHVEPFLTARNLETGATLRAEARKDGPVGHFTVDATFPSAGTWEVQITPEPFGPTELGRWSIVPPGKATISQSAPVAAPMFSPSLLRWSGIAFLLAAIVLAVFGRRDGLIRRRMARAS